MAKREQIQRFFEAISGFQRVVYGTKHDPLKRFKLSPPQAKVLYMLATNERTVKEIARLMGISSSAATQMIEGLVKLDYVQRKTDVKDRRVVHIMLTEKGKEKFSNFKEMHLKYMERLLADVTDQEMEVLISIPRKMINQLRKNNLK